MPYEVIDDQNNVSDIKNGKCPFCQKNTIKRDGMAPRSIEGSFGPLDKPLKDSEFDTYHCSNDMCKKYNLELLIPNNT